MFQFHFNVIFIWCTLLVEAFEIVSSLLSWELDMGEIDTKPIEPVQVGITLFDDKSDQRHHRLGPGASRHALEMEIEQLQKELGSYKVQLQAKDVAYSQLLQKLEHHQKTEQQLSDQLNNTKIERDVYFEEYKEAQHQIDELHAKLKDMNNQLSESGKTRQQLSHVLLELKTIQTEFLCLQTELATAQDESGKKLETIQELENQLLAKKLLIDSLQLELDRANELLSSSDKVVSDAINDLGKLKSALEEKEHENSEKTLHITVLETENSELKLELKNANEEIIRLTEELEKVKIDEDEAKERVTITMEEYRGMIEREKEMEKMKKEMEAAKVKVAEFRTRGEQARARAEASERAKMVMEEQLRKMREHKQRRKAALAALREESLSREFGSSSSSYDAATRELKPLGKILNIKF